MFGNVLALTRRSGHSALWVRVSGCTFVSMRIEPEQASERMIAAGVRPTVPYPGKNDVRWTGVCIRCGASVAPSLQTATDKRGRGGCHHCADAARAAAQRKPVDASIESALRDSTVDDPKLCGVSGCGRPVRARGLCSTHYARWNSTGGVGVDVPVNGHRWTQERAETMARSVGVELLEPFERIDHPVRFRCTKCGAEGVKSVHEMRYQREACWACSRITAGLHGRLPPIVVLDSVSSARFELIGEYLGARAPLRVRCLVCGTESDVRVGNLRSNKTKCRACADRQLAALFRLTDEDVAARAVLARIELLEPFGGTHESIKVRCVECGYEARRRINWSKPSKGCVRCGSRPFDFGAPSIVYLLVHAMHRALKIGVSNVGTNRLADHQRHGWEVANIERIDGESAYQIEQAVLRWWRKDLGLPPHLSSTEVPQGGWTETVSADFVEVPDAVAFVRRTAAQIRGGAAP